jgi:hypothetical protein
MLYTSVQTCKENTELVRLKRPGKSPNPAILHHHVEAGLKVDEHAVGQLVLGVVVVFLIRAIIDEAIQARDFFDLRLAVSLLDRVLHDWDDSVLGCVQLHPLVIVRNFTALSNILS